nr:AarF/ABC1/UbiB kinase family protein [Modestobacter muralis]
MGFAVGAVGLSGRFPFRVGLPGHEKGRDYTQPEHLRLALEELGPTFVKLGQVLSTRPDILPPDYLRELAKLQDSVAPIPVTSVWNAIAEELPDPTSLADMAPVPLASASIGQVHAAKVGDQDVVVKVRRPGAVETVEADLAILEDLAGRANRRWPPARDYDVAGIAHEFAESLRKELDYLREAHNAERFAANFADDRDVHIPAVFWETTTSRVLTLERVRGIKIDDVDALAAAGIDRRELAARATGVLCHMVFEDGFFHADPHPGNFFIRPDGSLAIIDFGMVGELTDHLREGLVTFLVRMMRGDLDGTTDALLGLATSESDVDRSALQADLKPLMNRFTGRALAEWGITELLSELLGLVRRHHMHLAHDLALLFKMLLMAEGLGQRLDPGFQIAGVLAPYADRLAAQRFSPAAVARRITELVQEVASAGAEAPHSMRLLAEFLDNPSMEAHLRDSDLRLLAAHADRVGGRVIAGVAAAALLNGLIQTAAPRPGPITARQQIVLLTEAGAVVALSAYLARTSPRRHRSHLARPS